MATPPGRDWPLLRDVVAIIAGGLHARADLLRLRGSGVREVSAAIAGVSAYVCLLVARNLTGPVRWLIASGDPALRSSAWLLLVAQLGVAAAMVRAWCCRRRTVVLAGHVRLRWRCGSSGRGLGMAGVRQPQNSPAWPRSQH